ncbi:MAG: 5'-3' exonuclease H3TH domain-containing protein, partial [Candidatus Omnitrophota bacterium]
MSKDENTIYLIDGSSLCYRAFYAIRDLSTSKGMPTNAIYGVVNMLRKLIKEYEPRMMTVVFDMKGPTTRHEKYEEYKIHRKPMPDDLSDQMEKIKEVISAYNIPIFQLEGYEADDIIATLAEKAKKKGLNVTIVTSDKDALQLIDKQVKVLSPHTQQDTIYGRKEVHAKYGVYPESMIELMALIGDSTDNIPGVKGVGRVTAEKLISKYGSVQNIYKNIDKIEPESLRRKLEEGKKMAELSRELVVLEKKVPVKIDIKEARMGEPDQERLAELFRKFEFEKLLREVMPKGESAGKYSVAKVRETVEKVIKEIEKNKFTAVSIAEESGSRKLEGVAFSCKEGKATYIPVKGSGDAFSLVKSVLEDGSVKKAGYDIKRDVTVLKSSGIEMKGLEFDIMIAEYLLDPSRPRYDLESM